MKIIFTNTLAMPMNGYEPVPAKKVIPEWYQALESYKGGLKVPNGEGRSNATIKRCMPVFDVMSAGYIIFSFSDIYVSHNKEGKHWFEWPSEPCIEFHSIDQAPTHPMANGWSFPKWLNPWAIKTPKGYSCLFLTPSHRELPFSILEGIVDTDSYVNNVNFPFQIKDKEFEGLIPAGTPIAQVIPFKRDSWKLEVGTSKEVEEASQTSILLRRRFYDSYKTLYRQTKDFS